MSCVSRFVGYRTTAYNTKFILLNIYRTILARSYALVAVLDARSSVIRASQSHARMDFVYCHDCRNTVHMDASAFDREGELIVDATCPTCRGIFLERFEREPDTDNPLADFARAISTILGVRGNLSAMATVLGDIDFTQFDTRNFDNPAAEGTIEALPEACADGATCSVCLTDFVRDERAKVLPCEHRFHAQCLGEWLKLVRHLLRCVRSLTDGLNFRSETRVQFAERKLRRQLSPRPKRIEVNNLGCDCAKHPNEFVHSCIHSSHPLFSIKLTLLSTPLRSTGKTT